MSLKRDRCVPADVTIKEILNNENRMACKRYKIDPKFIDEVEGVPSVRSVRFVAFKERPDRATLVIHGLNEDGDEYGMSVAVKDIINEDPQYALERIKSEAARMYFSRSPYARK